MCFNSTLKAFLGIRKFGSIVGRIHRGHLPAVPLSAIGTIALRPPSWELDTVIPYHKAFVIDMKALSTKIG